MEASIIVAIVGISGIIIGAALQFFLAKRAEDSKQFKLLQTHAYVDLLKSFAGYVQAGRFENKEKQLEYAILMTDSITRISVYGSSEVARKADTFLDNYSETFSKESRRAYAKLVKAMREDVANSDQELSEKEIESLLFYRRMHE